MGIDFFVVEIYVWMAVAEGIVVGCALVLPLEVVCGAGDWPEVKVSRCQCVLVVATRPVET